MSLRGLISGLAGSASDMLGNEIKREAEAEREQSMLRMKAALGIEVANAERNALVTRVDTAAGAIADKAVEGKRALVGSGIADPASWTPEQQAAVDQYMAADRDAIIGDPKTRLSASIATGDTKPEAGAKLMMDEKRLDASEKKAEEQGKAAAAAEERKALRDAQRYEVDLKKLDLMVGSQELQARKIDAWISNEAQKRDAAEKKGDAPKAGTAERMGSIVNAMNATIKNLDAEPPRSTATPEEKAEWKSQRESAIAVRARAMEKLNSNFDDAASPGKTGATPAPKAAKPQSAPIPSLPAGAKKIGTSGGKAVYETPDGKRFLEN